MIKLDQIFGEQQRISQGDIGPRSVKPARSTIGAVRQAMTTMSANPGYTPEASVK